MKSLGNTKYRRRSDVVHLTVDENQILCPAKKTFFGPDLKKRSVDLTSKDAVLTTTVEPGVCPLCAGMAVRLHEVREMGPRFRQRLQIAALESVELSKLLWHAEEETGSLALVPAGW